MTPINQAEIEVYSSEANDVALKANDLQIATAEQNTEAMEFKAAVKAKLKVVTEAKEKVTKPLNEALRNTRALFSPIEDRLAAADVMVGKKLLAYRQRMEAEARVAEAAIAKKVEAGRMRMDTAEKKMEAVQETKVEKTTQTNFGQVQFRKIQKVKFSDLRLMNDAQVRALINAGYVVWNEVAARKDRLAGVVIAGANVYEEETV